MWREGRVADEMTAVSRETESGGGPTGGSPAPVGILGIDGMLTAEELAFRDRVRRWVDERVRPSIGEWFDRGHFPKEIAPEVGELGLLGAQLEGFGCAGRGAVEYGLGAMELEAGDSGIRTFVSVQGSLAMKAIHAYGSDEQKAEWLPEMARGRRIGSFGLTEPEQGSDPSGLRTVAVKDGDDWILTGAKRWIGLASIADVCIVWARTDEGIRGFLVPTASPGFLATPIEPKLSMRASVQCDISLDGVRLPADAVLPGSTGLVSALRCLNEARYGIAWGVMGAARDSYEQALTYALTREQFGVPIGAFQLTQKKLVDMMIGVERGTLLALHLGRLKESGRVTADQISLAKLANTRDAIDICREARTVFGGNGIVLEHSPLRHANNLESVRTYEGTDEIHTLILGRRITGHAAFR